MNMLAEMIAKDYQAGFGDGLSDASVDYYDIDHSKGKEFPNAYLDGYKDGHKKFTEYKMKAEQLEFGVLS